MPELSSALTVLAVCVPALMIAAVVFWIPSRKSKVCPKAALGLPPGSVRARLALTLTMLYAIGSLAIFWAMAHPQERILTDYPEDRYLALPVDQVDGALRNPGEPATYTVTLRGRLPEGAQAVGQGVVTVLGTLVTAVAAFYFGSSTATSGQRAQTESAATLTTAIGAALQGGTGDTKPSQGDGTVGGHA